MILIWFNQVDLPGLRDCHLVDERGKPLKAIRIHQTGDPEVIQFEEVATPEPGEGQVLVKVAAAGVNFIDVYHRTGLYPKSLPFSPGLEGAGLVEAVGTGVDSAKVSDRVAFTGVPDSYAEYVVVPADRLVPVPDDVELSTAAAVMLQGMTAHYLLKSTYPVQAGDLILIHVAAGGVGLLLVQIAKKLDSNYHRHGLHGRKSSLGATGWGGSHHSLHRS